MLVHVVMHARRRLDALVTPSLRGEAMARRPSVGSSPLWMHLPQTPMLLVAPSEAPRQSRHRRLHLHPLVLTGAPQLGISQLHMVLLNCRMEVGQSMVTVVRRPRLPTTCSVVLWSSTWTSLE